MDKHDAMQHEEHEMQGMKRENHQGMDSMSDGGDGGAHSGDKSEFGRAVSEAQPVHDRTFARGDDYRVRMVHFRPCQVRARRIPVRAGRIVPLRHAIEIKNSYLNH